jgi:glycosidase
VADQDWRDEVLYFMVTDRFHDGDSENNIPEGSDPSLYDPEQKHIDFYHGGDFRGIEKAIVDGYFHDLGVTAIWITPPVRNAWYSLHDKDGPKTGYHGYWTQDFLDIDPHLTSATSLSGQPYPKGKEGRLQHYRDLIDLANRNGIKIVQDIVCNHIGPRSADHIRQHQVNFIDNHDGINRFLVQGVSAQDHDLALGLLMTSEGIPCLYYGSELAMKDPKVGPGVNSETGRKTLFDNDLARNFKSRSNNPHFQQLAELTALRRQYPQLVHGRMNTLELQGFDPQHVIAFQRGQGDDSLLVFVNTGNKDMEAELSFLSSMSSSPSHLKNLKVVFKSSKHSQLRGTKLNLKGKSMIVLAQP